MSLESALDEERREVMNILEGRSGPTRSAARSNSAALGQNGRTASPATPVRSMLDVEGPALPRHASGVTNPPLKGSSKPPSVRSVRSLLDPEPTNPPQSRHTHSATTSPIHVHPPDGGIHRALSDAAAHPPDGRRRTSTDRDRGGVNPSADYQFEMLPSIASQALPKRVTQGGKKPNLLTTSMASIMQGQELGSLPRGRDRGRHNSTAGIIGDKSKSPSSRLGNRSQSPGGSLLNANSFNLMTTPGKFVTDGGKVIDMNNAYRRLSDAALLKSGGNLSNLPARSTSERTRADSGEALSPTGGIRLQKDYYQNEDDDEAAIESSDEDAREGSSGDETWGSENLRGRRRSRRKKAPGGAEADWEDSENEGLQGREAGTTLNMGRAQHPRKVKSLLAAAEEERLNISSHYKVKSLLDPTVTVTGPGGERLAAKKQGVHPSTSYDHTASGMSSPVTSDTEAELTDIRRAQRMSVNMSPIDNSIDHRLIRTIIRGEFSKMQQEAEEGSRRLRTYLVATDLSDEAAYALEWTIGIVLRDGDTLIAVYAIDEETGSGKGGDNEGIVGVGIGEGAQAMQDTAAAIGSLTAATQNASSKTTSSPLAAGSLLPGTDSQGGSVDSRNMPKAEADRYHAIEDISQRCIRLVRKTKLQVRIAVEVIHCKSAKRLITEAIDGLEPTMVILGSRGRSALKGVLLGSFSNYLVTKSSVPVMVARRRLKKHAKDRKINPRLSNNLLNPSRLETAKID
ncbi:MAG: hypothetical protein M1830_000872 [Pleopsidium flavum]|nr:MAG: hypothetical protein M1830_000872 [Pleopsidium flavum]